MQVTKKGMDLYLRPPGGGKHLLVWMHGLGDSAYGFLDVFNSKHSPVSDTDVVLLTAPTIPVTINGGM